MDYVQTHYSDWFWGQWNAGWHAYVSFFRDELGLELEGDLWDRERAYNDADCAGLWWPQRQAVVVSDRPYRLQLEKTGQYDYRMHCEDGPAIAWGDGNAMWYWHGTEVPRSLIEDGWTVEQIFQEPNAEVRRCAIERMGWPEFVAAARLEQIGETVDDPGNPGHILALYDVPEKVFDEPIRLLLCTNATEERDGTRRRFGLTVPDRIADPIAAAAWTFDVTPQMYRQLARAC